MLDQGDFKDPVLVAEDDESGGSAAQEGGSEDSFGVSECAEEEGGGEGEDVVYGCYVGESKRCFLYHWFTDWGQRSLEMTL